MNPLYSNSRQYFREIKKYFRFNKIYSRYRQFTMVTQKDYIDCMDLVSKYKLINGAVIECGVWKGGMIAGMADVLLDPERNYYLFDSFEGLPLAKEIDGTRAIKWQEDKKSPFYYNNCSSDETWAEKAMDISSKKKYHIKKGWFENTIPSFEINEPIAILRLDADWYDSTMTCLVHLFPKVQTGGLIILDDYYAWDGCSKAVHEYLSRNKRPERIRSAYSSGCYIIKEEG
jgi:O-methyltransferase